MNTLNGSGVYICDHLQTVLTPLADLGKITLSTSGPPEPDESLLNHPEFWDVDTVQPASGMLFSNVLGGFCKLFGGNFNYMQWL